jgi:hypothetical protein
VSDDRCLSILGKSTELYIEYDTAINLNQWLEGIKHILTSSGRNVVDPEEKTGVYTSFSLVFQLSLKLCVDVTGRSRQGSGRRRLEVEYATPAALPKSPHETMKQMSEKRATLLAVSPEQTIAMMEAGRPFNRYYDDDRGNVFKQSVTLFYRKTATNGPLGTV